MSIVSIVYLPEGIVMAADSRLTGCRKVSNDNGVDIVEKFPLSDNSQKLILLNKSPVGIASFGTALINGKTISDYIRLFEIESVEKGDTPEDVVNKLFLKKNEFPGTSFYVCGYRNDEPYVYIIDSNGIKRNNITSDGKVEYNLCWGGEPEALNKLVNAAPIMSINKELMPLKDGIDLAEFMVDVTIKYQRFSDKIKTCGGSIDVLVLTKDKAFWYRNKLQN